MMKKFILLIVILFFISCGRTTNTTETPQLTGKWTWVKSSGGLQGKTETPISTGVNRVIEITNNSIKTSENGVLKSEITYTTATKTSIFGGQKEMLIYKDLPSQSYSIDNNKLFLYDECYDCYTSEYIRP